ncbi:helix-turn-helix domain-containing protein [Gorillibacterium sp. sgz5001074]|uniref:AraC family transcriptional regulator n=1 Tax=Gorillibacterium sp. sgz5001074 TaxID=3446695 RepID=UPI003F66EC90
MSFPFPTTNRNTNLWNGYEIDPFLRFAEPLVRSSLQIKPRKLMDYWLFWLQEGSVRLTYEETTIMLKQVDLILVQPNTVHHMEAQTPVVRGLSAHFDLFFHPDRDTIHPIMPDMLDPRFVPYIQPKWNDMGGPPLPLVLAPHDAPRFLAAFTEAVEQWENKSVISQLRAAMRITEMVAMLWEQYGFAAHPADSGRDDRLQWMLSYIHYHLDQPLEVHELARLLNLSPSRFFYLFKTRLGCSPHQMILRLRLERAEELLRMTDLPLGKIAEHCGFANEHHFSKLYKRKRGTTPGAARKALKLQP